jgi:hypothetical protein
MVTAAGFSPSAHDHVLWAMSILTDSMSILTDLVTVVLADLDDYVRYDTHYAMV